MDLSSITQAIPKKWMDILKALPYDGGPSTSRWVVLNVALVISVSSFILTCCLGWVYVRSPDHHFDALMGALVSATFTAMFAFATSTLNQKNALASGVGSSSTPVSSEVNAPAPGATPPATPLA